jgi:hypothetical protein
MALLEWEQGFSVNVAEIDRQHQKLIGMINALNDAMKEGKGKEVLAQIHGELSVYAGDHWWRDQPSLLKNQGKRSQVPSAKIVVSCIAFDGLRIKKRLPARATYAGSLEGFIKVRL